MTQGTLETQPGRYLTHDLPGIGGTIKNRPEDFIVEEVPLYEPCGEGEHLYIYVEKCRRTTTDVIRRFAKLFHVRQSDIGFAGLKDKHAVTRQHLSVYLPDSSNDDAYLERIYHTGVTLLRSARHKNKLRRGHLAGNHFDIRVRDVSPDVEAARCILDRLVATGAPNYLGEQRFGYRGDNAETGRLLLLGHWRELLDHLLGRPAEADAAATSAAREAYDRGDYETALNAWPRHLRVERHLLDLVRQGRSAEQAVAGIAHSQREFLISGVQSAVFNRVLQQRIADGMFDHLVEGDLAWKHDSRAVFAVDADTVVMENAPGGRVAQHLVSPSGPMWGSKMTRAAGHVDEREYNAMVEQGLEPEHFGDTKGARRPLRMFVNDADVSDGVDEHGPYLRVVMQLDRGCFATVVLDELMKTEGGSS